MDKFTIEWAHEAENWIIEKKRFSEKLGITWDPERWFYTPSKKVKKGLHNALLRIYDDVVLFTNIIMWFIGKDKDHSSMRIWFFDVEDRDGNGFYLDIWYEHMLSSTYYRINMDGDESEVGRVIFENLPSIDYRHD